MRLAVEQSGSGSMLQAVPERAKEWTVAKYALVLAVASIPAGMGFLVGLLVGEPRLGGVLAAAPFGLLTLIKPELGLYLFAAYLPFEGFSEIAAGVNATKVLGIFVFGAMLMHAVRRGYFELRVPGFWLALVFALWSLLSIWGARFPQASLDYIGTRFLSVGLLFLIVNVCLTQEQAKALFWAIFVSTVAAVFVPLVHGHVVPRWGVYRETVGEMDTNARAKILMGGLFLAPFLIEGRGRWGKLAIIVGMLVLLMGVIRTGSRTAFVAVPVGLLAAILTWRGMSLGKRVLLSSSIVVVLALFVFIGTELGFWEAALYRRIELLQEQGLGAGGRLYKWKIAWEAGLRHPFLGVGIGNYVAESLQHGRGTRAVHNDFLHHLAETGFPGLFLYVVFVLEVFRQAWRVAQPRLRACLIGVFVSAMVASLGNPSSNLKSFWLYMGLCLLGGLVFGREALGAPAEAAPAGTPPRVPYLAPLSTGKVKGS